MCIVPQEMCTCYWPTEKGITEQKGSVSIELLSEEMFGDYIHREIKLNETVRVRYRQVSGGLPHLHTPHPIGQTLYTHYSLSLQLSSPSFTHFSLLTLHPHSVGNYLFASGSPVPLHSLAREWCSHHRGWNDRSR